MSNAEQTPPEPGNRSERTPTEKPVTGDTKPPRWAQRFLEWYCRAEVLEDLQGDLHELFYKNCKSKGILKARLIYIIDVIKFLRSYTIRKPEATNAQWILYKNYYVTAHRNIRKYKLNTFINIAGLTMGITCFVVIALYVQNEYTIDSHYKNAERIYRASFSFRSQENDLETALAWSDAQLKDRLTDSFAEIEAVACLVQKRGVINVTVGSDVFQEDHYFDVDSSYFKVFSHHWLQGNPASALSVPGSIVLTEKLAQKYFKGKEALNKTILLNGENLVVTGVIRDLPANTHLKFDALVSFDTYFTDWCFTYILFNSKQAAAGFQHRLDTLFAEEISPILDENKFDGSYHLEALSDIHFGDPKIFDAPKGSKVALYTFMAISLLVLTISSINYINLSVAQSARRQAEIGVRKIFGAQRKQIRVQYMIESWLICSVSMLTAIVIIFYLLPWLRENHILSFTIEKQNIVPLVCALAFVVIFTTIAGGWYPALYLSQTNPLTNLQKKAMIGGNRLFRNGLIIVQFTASISLIFTTLIVYDQMHLLLAKNNSLTKDQVLVIDIPDDETLQEQLPQLKNEISSLSFVKGSSLAGYQSTPTHETMMDIFEVEQSGRKSIRMFNYIRVDENYFDVLGLQLAEGRKFNATDFDGDEWDAVLVNEALVKSMGWKNPLEQTVDYGGGGGESRIIGVVHDFGFHGMQRAIEPLIFCVNYKMPEKLLVRLSRVDDGSISSIATVWKKSLGGVHFEFRYLDDYFQQQLTRENTLQKLLTGFSILTACIACLGLFGIISITIAQKMKETGIRKIFGANALNILILTWKEYGVLIIISAVIAFPLAFLSVSRWLEEFATRTTVSFSEYLVAVAIMCGVMAITMLYHVVKIKKSDPLQSIKYE